MATSVTSATSHLTKPQDGFTTTTSGSVSSGATTVGLNSTGNYSNGDVVALIIDPADATKKQAFVGTINTSTNQVTGVIWTTGTNQSHASGATVVDYVTATHLQLITKWGLVQHKQDGTHANTITTDTINENTVGTGVTADGVLHKDSQIQTNNAIPANALATSAITLGYAEITSNTTQTSGSATLVSGLTASVTIPSGGRRIKITVWGGALYNTSAGVNAIVTLWDGTVGSGTQLAQGFGVSNSAAASVCTVIASVTPSAGAKTYNVGLHRGGSGTATLEASSTSPAFILVEAI